MVILRPPSSLPKTFAKLDLFINKHTNAKNIGKVRDVLKRTAKRLDFQPPLIITNVAIKKNISWLFTTTATVESIINIFLDIAQLKKTPVFIDEVEGKPLYIYTFTDTGVSADFSRIAFIIIDKSLKGELEWVSK